VGACGGALPGVVPGPGLAPLSRSVAWRRRLGVLVWRVGPLAPLAGLLLVLAGCTRWPALCSFVAGCGGRAVAVEVSGHIQLVGPHTVSTPWLRVWLRIRPPSCSLCVCRALMWFGHARACCPSSNQRMPPAWFPALGFPPPAGGWFCARVFSLLPGVRWLRLLAPPASS